MPGHHPYPARSKALTPDELAALWRELRADPNPVYYLVARTQYEIAGRIREALHLRRSDLRPANGTIHVRSLKRSADRTPIISGSLMAALLARTSEPDGLLFAGKTGRCVVKGCRGGHRSAAAVFRRVQAAALRAGIHAGLCRTHVLRHTALVDEARRAKGEDVTTQLNRIKRLSGHKSLRWALEYLTDPVQEKAHEEKRQRDLDRLGPV